VAAAEVYKRRAVAVARQIRAKHVRPRRLCQLCFVAAVTATIFAAAPQHTPLPSVGLAAVSGCVAITGSMPPTAKALTFLEMLARLSYWRHRKANACRPPGLFHDRRLLDEQRPTERRPYLI
jgi:hypothetical protein